MSLMVGALLGMIVLRETVGVGRLAGCLVLILGCDFGHGSAGQELIGEPPSGLRTQRAFRAMAHPQGLSEGHPSEPR
jgi:hypothetical protein